jgi:SAM-dependent methyltransferase
MRTLRQSLLATSAIPMSEPQSILNFSDFLASAAGRYMLDWEQRQLDQAVVDIFGYHALQLGLPRLDSLRENRMPLRCLALDGSSGESRWIEQHLLRRGPALPESPGGPADPGLGGRREVALVTRFDELPFASQSIDLLVLPHVLEFAQEPHRVLREADRVLVPEGQIVITGFNPASLWGARHWSGRVGVRPFLPASSQMIALPRLKDWLKLLSFDVNRGRFGCYVPPVRSESWIARWSFLEKAGDRWWPVLGSVYALTAIKRVHGMRLVGMVRKRPERRPVLAPVPAAQISQLTQRDQDPTGLHLIVPRGAAPEAANEPVTGVARG